MDAGEQGPGRHIERSGRIPIHLLLTSPEAAAQQQQQQQRQQQQQPQQQQQQLHQQQQPQPQQQYQYPPSGWQTAGSSSSAGAAGGRKESAAAGGLSSASDDPLVSSPISTSSPSGAPAASLNQIFGSSRARTEYTPLQPQQQHAPYSAQRVDGSSSTSPPWSPTDSTTRKPRAPRPSYSEEQKFFIMYTRIMRDLSWPEIEDRFADTFGQRSKGGLTSVYYRVRRDWGLAEVLKSGPGTFAADCREVELRARNFSKEFLVQIGYIPPS